MKLKNLLLGSVTAAGLMTSAVYAADLGVLTSVDVCDQLGLSGLTISSETNCLKISGEVSYNFDYGIWQHWGHPTVGTPAGVISWGYDYAGLAFPTVLKSEVKAKLNFEATADSSFGPAKAVIQLVSDYIGNGDGDVTVDQAYVSIGEGTVIMAGHKGSVFDSGDDEPLNWLGLFNSQTVNTGVQVDFESNPHNSTGTSNAVQVTHDLGNGFSLAAGLENLDGSRPNVDGNSTAVGVIAYKGENVSAHISVAAEDVLGDGNYWQMHAGIAATVESFKLVAAVATASDNQWNVLGSAEAALDIFTIAGSFEADDNDYSGGGLSIAAEVSDGVKLNLGGRWDNWGGFVSYEAAAGAEAKLAEDLTLSGAVGYVSNEQANLTLAYGWGELAWAPGGGFTASVKGTITNTLTHPALDGEPGPGYKIETVFKKTFE